MGIGGMSVAVKDKDGNDVVAVTAPTTGVAPQSGEFRDCTELADQVADLEDEINKHKEEYDRMVIRLSTCLLELPEKSEPSKEPERVP